MRIRDIGRQDIVAGKFWKLTDSTAGSVDQWIVQETDRISRNDVIFHSAVLVGREHIYLSLVSKYYEDGGETGDILILSGDTWRLVGVDGVNLEESTEGPYCSFVSVLDVHEYQKGSLDNRKIHSDTFRFYAGQYGRKVITRYEDKDVSLPQRMKRMSDAELLRCLDELFAEFERLSDMSNVTKSNAIAKRMGAIIQFLKVNRGAGHALRDMMIGSKLTLAVWIAYSLVDVYEKESLNIIKKVARGSTTEAMGAGMWLKEYKKKHNRWFI